MSQFLANSDVPVYILRWEWEELCIE